MRHEGRRWNPSRRLWNFPTSIRSFNFIARWGATCRDEASKIALDTLWAPPEHVGALPVLGSFTLHQYQADAVNWLRRRRGALLYDPPGLGKTLQGLAWTLGRENQGMILCPKPAVDQWIQEIKAADLEWNVIAPVSRGRYIKPVLERGPSNNRWYVLNYERLIRPEVFTEPFALIVDEATKVKNTKTVRFKSTYAVAEKANRVLSMTGNPVVNRPYDLWATFLLLGERKGFEFWPWMHRYTAAFRTEYGWDFSGATHLDELADEIKHFAIGRTYDEVHMELPELIKRTITIIPDDAHHRVAKKLNDDVLEMVRTGHSVDHGEGYQTLQRLRQTSALSKTYAVADWLKNHLDTGGGQVLVFSCFKEPLKRLAESLGVLAGEYHGDLSHAVRTANLELFKSGDKKVLLMTYDVGHLSLNLQMATSVILLDPPWTPKEHDQAIARAHRQGQKEVVQAIRVSAGHPVEAKIYEALEFKRSVTDAILGLDKPGGVS